MRILVVEDDPRLSKMLGELLAAEGYEVVHAYEGQRGLHLGLTESFDLLLLDRGLPGLDGLDLLGRLRRSGILTPALVLSALGNPADRVEGLDRGAEDYLAKPFDVDELLARLRALLRRHSQSAVVLGIPGGKLDVEQRLVTTTTGNGQILLTEKENELLGTLARRPAQVFSRPVLLERVFPDADDEGIIDTYVYYLRRKLGRSVVLTIRGIGYRLGLVT